MTATIDRKIVYKNDRPDDPLRTLSQVRIGGFVLRYDVVLRRVKRALARPLIGRSRLDHALKSAACKFDFASRVPDCLLLSLLVP